MSQHETVATGRSRRSTAGNRMRELLEKAHQQDEDELFAEVEDDEEFVAPQEQRDVFLEDFADTDDEVEIDEEEAENELRREERRKAKGKGKAVYNPLAPRPKLRTLETAPRSSSPGASSSAITLLDSSIDPATMAPSTLVLAMRKQRREAKRLNRSEARRSTMRASTLKTEADILAKEADEKTNPNRKGRRAQHETGEVRVVRKMTQDELIAAALEEEERNKEELRKWLRREEERRELRRVGRKRVRGPRWTWISRTVGKLVEVVEDKAVDAPMPLADGPREEKSAAPIEPSETPAESAKPVDQVAGTLLGAPTEAPQPTDARLNTPSDPAAPSNPNQSAAEALSASPATAPVATPRPVSPIATPAPALPVEQDTSSGQYTRNYLILSQIPGGLPAELKVVLGDHVEWDEVQYIPSRNRPINRRPPVCPFTGLPAKYRHPETLIPYAAPQGYREIEALLANRYVWNEEGGCWMGGEEDAVADGVEEVPGWREAMMGGWLAGKEIVEEPITEDVQMEEPEQEETPSKGKKRKPLQEQAATKVSNKSKKGKAVTAVVVDGVAGESDLGDMKDASGTPKKKSKRKR